MNVHSDLTCCGTRGKQTPTATCKFEYIKGGPENCGLFVRKFKIVRIERFWRGKYVCGIVWVINKKLQNENSASHGTEVLPQLATAQFVRSKCIRNLLELLLEFLQKMLHTYLKITIFSQLITYFWCVAQCRMRSLDMMPHQTRTGYHITYITYVHKWAWGVRNIHLRN